MQFLKRLPCSGGLKLSLSSNLIPRGSINSSTGSSSAQRKLIPRTRRLIDIQEHHQATNILWAGLPVRDVVLAGLVSSSMNSGSRTDTGLGRSSLSPEISEAMAIFVRQACGGDSNEDDGH